MINNKIMNQAFLNEIKLKIPEDYLVADKNTIVELVNERFKNDEIHKDFLLPFMNMIESGNMILFYNPNNYEKELGTCNEYINLIIEKQFYIPINDEEDLTEEKEKFKQSIWQAYGVFANIFKFELSKIPSFAKVSTYCEMDGVAENTFSAQYSFFPSFDSEYNYTISLTCTNQSKNKSLSLFSDIANSIERN